MIPQWVLETNYGNGVYGYGFSYGHGDGNGYMYGSSFCDGCGFGYEKDII